MGDEHRFYFVLQNQGAETNESEQPTLKHQQSAPKETAPAYVTCGLAAIALIKFERVDELELEVPGRNTPESI